MTPEQLEQWHQDAKALRVQLDDAVFLADRKVFSTGSRGWHASRKLQVLVGTTYYTVQVNLCITLVGSKPGSPAKTLSEAQEAVLFGKEADSPPDVEKTQPQASQELETASGKPKRAKKRPKL
jgi:hypothetical protein